MFRNLTFFKFIKYLCMFAGGLGVFVGGLFPLEWATNNVPYQASLMVYIILFAVLCVVTVGSIFLVRAMFDYGELGIVLFKEWQFEQRNRSRQRNVQKSRGNQTRAQLKR